MRNFGLFCRQCVFALALVITFASSTLPGVIQHPGDAPPPVAPTPTPVPPEGFSPIGSPGVPPAENSENNDSLTLDATTQLIINMLQSTLLLF
jgi:hypothetical protein